jgi:hypothetical protein
VSGGGPNQLAWIGLRPFYDKAAGIVGERRFLALG